MFRKILLAVGLSVLLITVVNLLYADQTVPLPGRTTVEMLTNGDFENDTDNNKIPDGWTAKNTLLTKADKIKCDKVDDPVAHSGTCAFMFKGNPGSSSSNLAQTLPDLSFFTEGAFIEFTAYIDPRSGTPGELFGKAQLQLSDGSKLNLKLSIPETASRAPGDYVPVTASLTLDLNDRQVTRIKVKFSTKQDGGKFLIDTATLTVTVVGVRLTAGDGAYADHFGNIVDLSGESLIVGAAHQGEQGAAYVFTGSGIFWGQQQKLTADDSANGDQFGIAVALEGDTAIVGASNHQTSKGAVYVFKRSAGVWIQEQKLTASDGVATDHFGGTLELEGDTLVIGAWGKGTGQGAVYIFTLIDDNWTEQQILTASDGADADEFGMALALDDDTLLIGATHHEAQGAVYVFEFDGETWVEQQKLTASDGNLNDFFGVSIALEGDTALIGSPNWQEKGAFYVFTRTEGLWTEQDRITGSDSVIPGDFGQVVTLSGDTAIITDDNNGNAQGAAYLFELESGVWIEKRKILAPDGLMLDFFGQSASLDQEHVLIGAPDDYVNGTTHQGSVWVFALDELQD